MISSVEQFWKEIRDFCRDLQEHNQPEWAGDLANAFSTQPGVEQMAHARSVFVKLNRSTVSDAGEMKKRIRELVQFTDVIGKQHQIQWKDPES